MKSSTVKNTKTTTMSIATYCYPATFTNKCPTIDCFSSKNGDRLVFSSLADGCTTRSTHQNLSFCCSEDLLLLIHRPVWFLLVTRSMKSTKICLMTQTTTEGPPTLPLLLSDDANRAVEIHNVNQKWVIPNLNSKR